MENNNLAKSQKKANCTSHLIKFDASRHYFQFYLPDGRTRFQTRAGGIISIILGILILTYASSEFAIFWMRDSYIITEKFLRNSLKDLDHFNKTNRFSIAASFIDNGNQKIPDDPEVGQLKFFIKSWKENDEVASFRELITRSCFDEDFLIQNDETMSSYGFYPLDEMSKKLAKKPF